ncbi:MAG: hypothetical protein ABSC51_03010 [Gaiellaceae bacterium]|jgi:uncharacterized protein (DUF697 family)
MPRSSSLSPRALLRLATEQRKLEAEEERPLVLSGARRLVAKLARELTPGASPGSLSEGEDFEHAEAVVYLLHGEPKSEDRRRLRAAGLAHVPIVCVRIGEGSAPLPEVLATDIARVPSAEQLPVEEIGRLLARRLEGRAAGLAVRVPVLRPWICREMIQQSARRAAALGAAVFVPAPDLPPLFFEQARLILRLGYAHGRRLEPLRAAELVAVLAAGLGFRRIARRVRGETFFPVWALQGSIAYAGTRALGEAALLYFSGDGHELGPPGPDRV